MRPTDKEIEEKFYTMSTEKAGSEQDRAQWEQANRERLKQQEAAKWARNFDPWYYTEDGDLPKVGEQILFVTYDLYNYAGKILYNSTFDFYFFFAKPRICKKDY